MTAVALLHRDLIISELATGKRLSDIAPGLGVSPNAISLVLKNDKEYRDAIEQGFHCRLDNAEKILDDADTQLDVARGRALFQSVAWRAERECREVWGQSMDVKVDASLTVHVVRVAGDDQRVIEGESVQITEKP